MVNTTLSENLHTQETANQDVSGTSSVYDDLISLLCDAKPEVRIKAAELVLSLTEDHGFLTACNDAILSKRLCSSLLRGLGSSFGNLSEKCCAALVNLSHTSNIRDTLIELDAIKHLMDNVKDQQRQEAPSHPALNLLVLNSLTQHDDGLMKFLGMNSLEEKASVLSELFIHRLVEFYLKPPSQSSDGQFRDQYLFVGHILVNITRFDQGRECIFFNKSFEEATGLLNCLSPQMLPTCSNFSVERRGTLLQLFRNLTMDSNIHSILCKSLIPHVLCSLVYPPRGSSLRRLESVPFIPEDGGVLCQVPNNNHSSSYNLSKERKLREGQERPVDSFIDEQACGLIESSEHRKAILDALQFLLLSVEGRQVFRSINAYNVIRIWHLIETDDEIIAHIENVVPYLIYDEDEILKLRQ